VMLASDPSRRAHSDLQRFDISDDALVANVRDQFSVPPRILVGSTDWQSGACCCVASRLLHADH
jgi:hypothetical protein